MALPPDSRKREREVLAEAPFGAANCIAKPESYEERKARRESEVNGLKEALSILESETAFMQRGKRSFRGSM